MEENIRSMVESGSAGMCMWVASVRGCIKQKGQRDIIGCGCRNEEAALHRRSL